jgi:predicted DNA-binding transcriptional regulator AlpA
MVDPDVLLPQVPGMDGLVDPQQLRERFGLVTEEDFAAMLGVTRGTLKNRPHSRLPKFVKAGRRRLFKEESVREYFGVTGPAPPPRSSVTKIEGGIQPRGLNKEEAARYVGIDLTTFDALVDRGQMPDATRIGKREGWDRLKLDAAFSLLG